MKIILSINQSDLSIITKLVSDEMALIEAHSNFLHTLTDSVCNLKNHLLEIENLNEKKAQLREILQNIEVQILSN